MSLAARNTAQTKLASKPGRATVEAWIKSLEENTEYLLRTQLCGMDGHARSIHMNSTMIEVYEDYLSKLG